jgi:divalent metal cation (Fe/Co/Zn/Cd) transporter
MSQHIATTVIILKTLTLVLGGVITFYSYRAYRRTASRALRALALGFGLVTLGALLAGIVDQLIAVDPNIALVVESLFTTVGFAIILYSLYVE